MHQIHLKCTAAAFPCQINAGCEAGTWLQEVHLSVNWQTTETVGEVKKTRQVISAREKWLKRFRWLTELQHNYNRTLRIEKKMVHHLFFWNEIEYIVEREREQYGRNSVYCCATQRASKYSPLHINPCLSPLFVQKPSLFLLSQVKQPAVTWARVILLLWFLHAYLAFHHPALHHDMPSGSSSGCHLFSNL